MPSRVMKEYERRLCQGLQSNDWFMRALAAVRDCDPPDWLVGGGVIRSTKSTPGKLRAVSPARGRKGDSR
jgi:hypothetical protein